MSEHSPQVGDRVRMVAREGTVTQVNSSTVGVRYDDGRTTNVWRWEVDKISPPLPTAVGSVIKFDHLRCLYFLTAKGWRHSGDPDVPVRMDGDFDTNFEVLFNAGAE